jgi:hypothetical protein
MRTSGGDEYSPVTNFLLVRGISGCQASSICLPTYAHKPTNKRRFVAGDFPGSCQLRQRV